MKIEKHAKTWRRVQSHQLPSNGRSLSFAGRLARENRWSLKFTDRVLDEYRKFCFLAVTTGRPVTPSDAVDQAWHLHLTYSEDYWEEFCPNVLGQKLHHGPTRGGKAEDRKYREWYQKTLQAYQDAFGRAPADIWPASAERFTNAGRFVRVNAAENLFIPRRQIRLAGVIFGAAAVLGLSSAALAAGAEFAGLGMWLVVAVVAAFVVGLVALAMQQKGRAGDKSNSAGGGCGGINGSGKSADSGDGSSGCSGGGAGCAGGCGGG